MPSPAYIVRKGDTLWDISEKYLHSPYEWPRLWRHNNRKDIIAITGQGINNPDLIYPGQKLLLPLLTSTNQETTTVVRARQQRGRSSNKSTPLMEQLKEIKTPIALKYALDEMTVPPIVHPNAVVQVKMAGSVVLSSISKLPITHVVNKGDLEVKMTNEANHAFGSLVSDLGVAYDESTGKVTIGMNLIAKSRTPNIPTSSIGIVADSDAPIPKIKYEIKLPELKGQVGNFNYVASNVAIAVEVTPTGTHTRGSKTPAETSTGIDPKIIATGLALSATLLIVGTIVEDFFTAGAGVADDPVSFSAAAALYARSAALWQGSVVTVQRALLPAMTTMNVSVVPAGAKL